MTDRVLSITLTARDGASQTFRVVGDSAKTLADTLEDISGEGADAFDDLADSAKDMGAAVQQAATQGQSANQQLAQSARDVEQAYDTVGKTLATAGAAGTAFFAFAVNESNQLQSAMRNVNSIAGLSDEALSALTGQVRELGVELAIDPSQLAAGLYDIQGSGFEAAEALTILRTSAVAARAGLTETSVAAQAITAVLNAYNLSADEAGNVSDVLFKIVDSGVISFETLARNMGSVLPIAAQLKVPLEEIAAAYAELTVQGISGPIAETGIAAIMRSALQPTQELTDALERYGYTSAEALIQTEGFAGFLMFLQEASGGSSSAMFELLGTIEAATPALALLRNEGENYNRMLEEMGVAAQGGERTLGVFEEQTSTTAFALQRLRAEFRDFRIEMGDALSPIVGGGADALTSILGVINDLPGPLQTAIGLFGALGSAAALGMGGLILAVPKIVEFRNAAATLGGLQGILAATAGRFAFLAAAVNPLTLTLGAVVGVGALVAKSWYDQKKAADEYRGSISTLEMTLEMLRRQGDEALAEAGQTAMDTIDSFVTMERSIEGLGMALTPGSDAARAVDEQARAIDQLKDEANLATPVMEKLDEALNDPNIDADAYLRWALGLLEAAAATEEATDDVEALQTILDRPLSDFSRHIDGGTESVNALGQAAESTIAPVQSLLDLFGDFPAVLDDLRLDGQHDLVRDIEGMGDAIEQAFIHLEEVTTFRPNPLSPTGVSPVTQVVEELKLTEPELDAVGAAWDRVMSGMESGLLDNTALMAEWSRILSDSTLTDQEKVASLTTLSTSLSDYVDSVKGMQDAHHEWLATGENILDWWEAYTALAGGSTDAPFANLVDWAQEIGFAGAALDQVLRTFEQIDSLGQRSSSAASIADALIGAPGERGTLQDLWSRMPGYINDTILSQEDYNQAIERGVSIQESNVRVQDYLTAIRAKQIPLLEAEQVAYEENIRYLATLGPLEQRRALMLQDSGIQAKIASDYALAYSASVGEIPEEVASEVILNSVQADAALKDLYLQLGLIEEDPFTGEVKVVFPDSDQTINAIDRITLSILHMQAAFEGRDAYDIAVEVYGKEEADALFGLLDENDGKSVTTSVSVEVDTPFGRAKQGLQKGLRNLLGLDEDPEPVTVPATVVWQGDAVSGDGTGGATNIPGLPDEVTIPASLDWSSDTTLADLGGESGPTITLAVDDGPVAEAVAQYAGQTVEGPTLALSTDSAQVTAALAVWDGVHIPGPILDLTADSEAVTAALLAWEGAAVDGPVMAFSADSAAVSAAALAWNGIELPGPVMDFSSDTSAVSAAALAWNGVSLPGPVLKFSADVSAVSAAASAYDGKTVGTAYIDIVTRTVGMTTYSANERHGGIPGMAGGGIPVELAEAGPELLYFAGGGTLPIFRRGIYDVPPMTYVSPANANAALQSGGASIYAPMIVNAPIYGVDDLNAWFTGTALPALSAELDQHDLAMGVTPS